jgi:lysozyme
MTIRRKAIAGGTAVALATAAFAAPWEGFEPVAKHERIDPPNVITYGYGRTNYDDPNLKPGDRISEQQAREFLASDLENKYLPPIWACINGFDLMPPWRKVAFLDASYNLGPQAVCRSAMVRKLNAGDVQGACDAFLMYDRANGKILKGLQRRREAERELCLRP